MATLNPNTRTDPVAERDRYKLRQVERALSNEPAANGRVRGSLNDITPEAVASLRSFQTTLELKRKSASCVCNYIAGSLAPMCRELGKPPEDLSPREIAVYLSKKGEACRHNTMKALRSFHEVHRKDKRAFEPIREETGATPYRLKRKDSRSLVTNERLSLLKKSLRSYRDRAFVAALFESGMRLTEFLNIRLSDIDFSERHRNQLAPVYILVRTSKTAAGERRRPRLLNSIPLLMRYLELEHPRRNEPKFLQSDILLWMNRDGSCLSRSAVARLLHEAARRAGVEGRIFPHLFRTSRLTELRYRYGLEPEEIKELAGHASIVTTFNSYIAVDNDAIDRKLAGGASQTLAAKEKARQEYLKETAPRFCLSCDHEMDSSATLCDRCGCPVDEKAAIEEIKKRDDALKAYAEEAVKGEIKREMARLFKQFRSNPEE